MDNAHVRIAKKLIYWTQLKLFLFIVFLWSIVVNAQGMLVLGLAIVFAPYLFVLMLLLFLMFLLITMSDWYRLRWIYYLVLSITVISVFIGIIMGVSAGERAVEHWQNYGFSYLSLVAISVGILWVVGDIFALRSFVYLSGLFSRQVQSQTSQAQPRSTSNRHTKNKVFYVAMMLQIAVVMFMLYTTILWLQLADSGVMMIAPMLLIGLLAVMLVAESLKKASSQSDYYGRVGGIQGWILFFTFVALLFGLTQGTVSLLVYIASAVLGSISLSHWHACKGRALLLVSVRPIRHDNSFSFVIAVKETKL